VGWAETFEVLPAILVVGASFSLTQYLWSNHVDSNLVDIAGGVVSLLATVVFLRFWRPKRIWRFEEERAAAPLGQASGKPAAARRYTAGQIAKAWMPFAILSLTVLVWGLPSIKGAINKATTPIWNVPLLHNAVTRAAPVVTKLTPEAARYDFNWLSATGTGCFIAAIIAGLVLGVGPVQLAKIFWYTLKRMRLAVIAISFMLGLGFTTRYSGLDAVLGLAFTRTGWLFPFFGTYLGWLGVALTGSDTSSNALFGSLQRITAPEQLRTYECDGLTNFRVVPSAVVLPTSTEQVQAIVLVCYEARIPFVARGSGTGLSGGALPIADGIVISLARMNRILDVD